MTHHCTVASTVVLTIEMTHDIRFMMTFSITDIMSYCFLSGTIVTVANLGDSRVILGYQKDISPPGSSPRPKIRVTAPDSPGTSHEEISVHSKPQNGEEASARSADSCSLGVDDVEVDTRQWGIMTTMPLSTDHKPDDPREAAVIIAAGKPPCHAALSCQVNFTSLNLSYLNLFHLTSSYLILSYFILLHLFLTYFTLLHLILSYLILSYLILSYLNLFHLTSSYLILSYLNLFHLTSSYLISPHFLSSITPISSLLFLPSVP